MFRFFFISIALCFIVSCTPIMRYETGRNPKNKKYCHLHKSKLYTTKADIFFGPYCPIGINKKITPDGLDGVSKKFMTHLRCLIKTHPFNDPNYPAVNWGPRKILGSVELHNECINSKPVLKIETVWNLSLIHI